MSVGSTAPLAHGLEDRHKRMTSLRARQLLNEDAFVQARMGQDFA